MAADLTPRDAWDKALKALEGRLQSSPEDLDLMNARAGLLAAAGRTDAARAQYLAVLERDPTHYATLNNFGVLLCDTHFRTAGRTAFEEAVKLHPHQPAARVNLAKQMLEAGELESARRQYEIALSLDPDMLSAHQQLSEVLRETGDLEGMRRHRRLGYAPRPVEQLPYFGAQAPVLLLVITSRPAGDLVWRPLVDEDVFQVTTLVAEYVDPASPLPPHHLIFNAVGDADLSRTDLHAASRLLARSTAPVINAPEQALQTGRAENAARLGRLDGVRAPHIAGLDKAALTGPSAAARLADLGFIFPQLLRSPGFHTGRHFVRVDRPEALATAAAALPGDEVLVIDYLDATGADGLSRKYRVMMIDGALYPLHMVAAAQWKAHYFTGAMGEDARLQAEEARFLSDMAGVIGPRGMNALNAIQGALGLDYAGIDFAVDPAGDLILFEANAVMAMVPPDASPRWDYRRAPIERAIAAARAMLVRRGQAAKG